MKWMKVSILAVLITVGLAPVASAQNLLAERSGTAIWGIKIPVWNTTDSLISDGMIVVLDTTTTAVTSGGEKRLGVRAFLPASHQRYRVVGIAAGNIQKSSRGGNGAVLVYGYHPRAFLQNSAAASAFGAIKISLSVEGSFVAADSAGTAIGTLIAQNPGIVTNINGASGTRYTGKVWVRFMGPYAGP